MIGVKKVRPIILRSVGSIHIAHGSSDGSDDGSPLGWILDPRNEQGFL